MANVDILYKKNETNVNYIIYFIQVLSSAYLIIEMRYDHFVCHVVIASFIYMCHEIGKHLTDNFSVILDAYLRNFYVRWMLSGYLFLLFAFLSC